MSMGETEVPRVLSLPEGAYEVKQDCRKLSSVVLQEEYLEPLPEPTVRYVEVPQIEEVIRYVVKKEVREVERIVPKHVEKFVDKYVEVPKYVEEIKEIEEIVPVEVVKKVAKVVYDYHPKPVEHAVEVPHKKAELRNVNVEGEIIAVPKTIRVKKQIPVCKYEKIKQQLIVAQTVKPVIVEGAGEVHVDVTTYEPEVVPVDIHIAKFVDTKLVKVSEPVTEHKVVSVPPSQYNSMLDYLNQHLTPTERSCLPYIQNDQGQVQFMKEPLKWKAPAEGTKVDALAPGKEFWSSGTVVPDTLMKLQDGKEKMMQARTEAEAQYTATIAEYEQQRKVVEQRIADYNAAERRRAEEELVRLNHQFDQEYYDQLEAMRTQNTKNESDARQGLRTIR